MTHQNDTTPEHEQGTTEHLSGFFAQHGLRCTRQRKALYKVLASTDTHPTAEELYATLAQTSFHTSLATVYNTLEAFCQTGLAIKIPGKGSSARYDAITHNHLHARDTLTGQVADIPEDLSQALIKRIPKKWIDQIQKRLGFQIDQIQIELVGRFETDKTLAPSKATIRQVMLAKSSL